MTKSMWQIWPFNIFSHNYFIVELSVIKRSTCKTFTFLETIPFQVKLKGCDQTDEYFVTAVLMPNITTLLRRFDGISLADSGILPMHNFFLFGIAVLC